jgi:hypothetical protein
VVIKYYSTAQFARIFGLPKDRLYDAKNKRLLVADKSIGKIDAYNPFRLKKHLASIASCISAQEYVDALQSLVTHKGRAREGSEISFHSLRHSAVTMLKAAGASDFVASLSQLPVIPGYPYAPERCQRIAALRRELSRLCANGTYFLSYRDAAKACESLSYQEAHTITLALARLGVIKIVRKGKARLNDRKDAEFRYALPQTEDPCDDDEGFDL